VITSVAPYSLIIAANTLGYSLTNPGNLKYNGSDVTVPSKVPSSSTPVPPVTLFQLFNYNSYIGNYTRDPTTHDIIIKDTVHNHTITLNYITLKIKAVV
ncbi:MAG: hypothetical protein WCP19_03630, partial [Chloroflexota bacterium]